ncbi:hypothetical protein [Zavarzinella formosa]|uniref:hypothetical protein n=1 Tax=Zavarzinella formosa TaxID=360055 RepID=UPI00030A2CB6|nr:hypothetical protein [Zavarzinella formosa]
MPSANVKLGLLAFGLVGGLAAMLLIGLGALLLTRDNPKPPESRPAEPEAVAKTKTPVTEKPSEPVSDPGVENGKAGSAITVYGKIDYLAPGADGFFQDAKDTAKSLEDPNYVPPKRPATEFYLFMDVFAPSGKVITVCCLIVKEGNDLDRGIKMKHGDVVGIRGEILHRDLRQPRCDLFMSHCQIFKWPAGR